MQIWAETGKSALPIHNYSHILCQFFEFTQNLKRSLRKVTKLKTIFPTDDALFKMLYLAMMGATKKWTGKTWDWGPTPDQLCIYFADRITPEDLY